ncbi:MAG: IclR family transcriptional regulator [Halobacteriales archaeon]
MTTSDTYYEIDATATSIAVLEYLVESGTHVGVSEVAEELEISKSMAYNHLSTLRDLGLVAKRDRTYAPSMRLLTLGERTRDAIDVFEEGHTAIENLAEATGEVAGLFIMEEQYSVPVYIESGPVEWEPPHVVGERMPLHVSAAGKAILASLSSEQVGELLDGYELTARTDQTVTDADALMREISQARESGVLFCREEQYPGVVSVGTAIEAPDSPHHASIAVVGPAERFHGRYLEEDLVGQAVSTAKKIEVSLTD